MMSRVDGFCFRKKRKFACSNALEFAMTIVMWHNYDQDNGKTLEAQSETMAADERMHYFEVTIHSKKKQNTHIA